MAGSRCAMVAISVVSAMLVAVDASPIFSYKAVTNASMIQGDPLVVGTGNPDWVQSYPDIVNVQVPCSFCEPALDVLLGVCKDSGGRSVENVGAFLEACADIGGKHKMDEASQKSSTIEYGRYVNKLYEKRMRCRKILESMIQIYKPYDPCNQLRPVMNRNPGTICNSPELMCIPDPHASFPGPPPWTETVYYEPNAYSCKRYVRDIVKACDVKKRADFYSKSDLSEWCNKTYSGVYQVEGCNSIVNHFRMVGGDMDACNTLRAFPVEDDSIYCTKTLGLKASKPVDTGYDQYIEDMKTLLIYSSTPFQTALLGNVTDRFPLPYERRADIM